jgi:hypothetical protein
MTRTVQVQRIAHERFVRPTHAAMEGAPGQHDLQPCRRVGQIAPSSLTSPRAAPFFMAGSDTAKMAPRYTPVGGEIARSERMQGRQWHEPEDREPGVPAL